MLKWNLWALILLTGCASQQTHFCYTETVRNEACQRNHAQSVGFLTSSESTILEVCCY